MAITWDYNEDYVGRYYQWNEARQGYCTCNVYTGNCLFICNFETDKYAQLANFAIDEQHLKNCLTDSRCYGPKDKFVFNTNNKSQMTKVKTAIKLLLGHVQIEIRPKNDPIEKFIVTDSKEVKDNVI